MPHHEALRALLADWLTRIRESRGNAVLGILMFLALAWVYGSILANIVQYAVSDALWYHCLAVPFAAAWIWFRQRAEIAKAPVGTWWGGGLALLLLSVLFRLGEVGEGGALLGGASLVLAVAAVVALLEGKQRLYRSIFPIVFLAFAIPIPKAVFGFMAFPMQNLSSALTALSCQIMGLPVAREGVMMAMGDFQVTVASACSGLNSMFALMMVGTWIIGFSRVAWYHRIWMFATIVPIVIMGNIFRLVVMMVVALFANGELALGFFHEGSDLVIFLLLVNILLSLKLWLERRTTALLPPGEPALV